SVIARSRVSSARSQPAEERQPRRLSRAPVPRRGLQRAESGQSAEPDHHDDEHRAGHHYGAEWAAPPAAACGQSEFLNVSFQLPASSSPFATPDSRAALVAG